MRTVRATRSPGARQRRSWWPLVLVAVLLVSPYLWRASSSAASQTDATPAASPASAETDQLDLAAIAIDAADLPDGYVLQTERYTPGPEWVAESFPGDEFLQQQINDAGLEWWYESTYGLVGTLLTVRTYVQQYADAAGMRDGFDVLEDEGLHLPPDAPVEDVALPGVDADPAELTLVDWKVSPDFSYRSTDATFGRDRLLVGVEMESIGGTIPPDRTGVENLAVRLDERLQAVLAGGATDFADPALAVALLPSGGAEVLQEGHLADQEIVPARLSAVQAAMSGSYLRTVGLPFPNAVDAPPVLFVNLAVSRFASADDALAALYALESLTIPTPLPPLGESFRQQGALPEVAGADAVNAVRRALLPGGLVDSVRLGFVAGDALAVIDVAGAASIEAAEEVAASLADLQAACLTSDGECQTALPVAELQTSALETAPAPAPVTGDADRAAVFDDVWRTIAETYLYRTGRQGVLFANYHEVDWNAVRAEYESRALAAASDDEFHRIVAEMVAELGDQHTGYLSPADARADDALFAGEPVYVGIGALLAGGLDPTNPGLVLHVFPDSPAETAGLARRDLIEAVDGLEIAPLDDEQTRELIDEIDTLTAPDQAPADPGPPLSLTVRSPGAAPRQLVVERAVGPAPISPVVERLESAPSIVYVLLLDFVTPDLNAQVVARLESLLADGPIDGIVLDVRANPGGSLFVTQSIMGQFISGAVGTFYSRDGVPPAPFNVEPGVLFDQLRGVPLVVLTDDRMFSASEVTASVLQNEGRATVVGVTSPGDVEVLIPVGFADGSRIYIAVQLFDLPGRIVEGQGVVPDVLVAEDWIRYPFAEDPQVAAAVEIIRAGELEPAAELNGTPEA